MPGRPSKVRRKEANESRKTGKLIKRGVVMTCSKCGTQGHNKRGCPTRNQVGPSQSTEPSSQARGTGPSQLLKEQEEVTTRGSSSTQSPRASSHATTNNEIGRGRGTRTATQRGRGMTQHSQTSSEATCSGRGLERGKRPVEHEDTSGGQTRPFKRQRMIGIGIYQALNPRLPSRRVINIGTRVTERANVVTGDIGYTPVRGFKWKGKTTITSSNLERMRAEKVIQTRFAATANSQCQTSSIWKTLVPWK
ncbi:hypothetical protein KY284_000614 [Solanum tuberosum]|nr:hypothetical protein KY284_000614 [Solanum tuberosum]